MTAAMHNLEQGLPDPVDEPTVDRAAFSVVALDEADDERAYWWSRTPQERMRHLEYLRRVNYGDRAGERLQRVFEVVECTPRGV